MLIILKKIDLYHNETKSEFNSMKSEFNSMKSRIDSIESRIDSIESEMRKGFKKLTEYLTGERTIKKSIKSSVNLMSLDNKIRACGNLIIHKNRLFVITAKHAILQEKEKCLKPRKIFHQESKKFIEVEQIFTDPNYDFAILSINEDGLFKFGKFAAEYSMAQLKFNQKLLGVCFRKKNPVFENAYVKEFGDEGHVLTNHGGSPGQSGCGYFNIYGKLSAIHLGSEKYKHQKNEKKRTKKDSIIIHPDQKKVWRNPRTRVGAVNIILKKELSELQTYEECK